MKSRGGPVDRVWQEESHKTGTLPAAPRGESRGRGSVATARHGRRAGGTTAPRLLCTPRPGDYCCRRCGGQSSLTTTSGGTTGEGTGAGKEPLFPVPGRGKPSGPLSASQAVRFPRVFTPRFNPRGAEPLQGDTPPLPAAHATESHGAGAQVAACEVRCLAAHT